MINIDKKNVLDYDKDAYKSLIQVLELLVNKQYSNYYIDGTVNIASNNIINISNILSNIDNYNTIKSTNLKTYYQPFLNRVGITTLTNQQLELLNNYYTDIITNVTQQFVEESIDNYSYKQYVNNLYFSTLYFCKNLLDLMVNNNYIWADMTEDYNIEQVCKHLAKYNIDLNYILSIFGLPINSLSLYNTIIANNVI
jgi:hypothetical protein